eukprot:CAMPEP_0177701570 /NCGR_PEP_ID=MMETSP0484_2-20121128/6679_1 /TAXON_ID=354590 /ORGANISM="Rhodomonas lens, Strain RHODO" /LENGTH=121 /DNA_ID=CAMNT_0019212807 /DNA_START=202 /DNA_END=568 /DNA_ORIENTATION=+
MVMARQATQFESKVYQLCKQIPVGMVSTYGDLANALNTSPRAVGQAMRRNPFAPEVPCQLQEPRQGGYFGESSAESEQVQRKRCLLQEEGVLFEVEEAESSVRVSEACVFSFMADQCALKQ